MKIKFSENKKKNHEMKNVFARKTTNISGSYFCCWEFHFPISFPDPALQCTAEPDPSQPARSGEGHPGSGGHVQ